MFGSLALCASVCVFACARVCLSACSFARVLACFCVCLRVRNCVFLCVRSCVWPFVVCVVCLFPCLFDGVSIWLFVNVVRSCV